MWRLDRLVQDRSVSNFDVVRRFVVHPKEEFYMRFKKRAVLLAALAVTAVGAATVTQPASARPQYPIGSSDDSVDRWLHPLHQAHGKQRHVRQRDHQGVVGYLVIRRYRSVA